MYVRQPQYVKGFLGVFSDIHKVCPYVKFSDIYKVCPYIKQAENMP